MKKIIIPALIAILLSGTAFAQHAATAKKKTAVKGKTAKTQKAKPKVQKNKEITITSLALGSPIPNGGFIMEAANGEMTSFDQAKTENGLLVMFSCNTCPYVIKAQNRTNEAMSFAKRFGIGMVILNSNEANRKDEDAMEKMKLYGLQQHYTVPYLLDINSQMADIFGATRTPEVFLFNNEGLLVYKGALEDNPSEPQKSKLLYLADAMKALVNHTPIKVAETKSIGCSIKRIQVN